MQRILELIAPDAGRARQIVDATLAALVGTAFTDPLTSLLNGVALERLTSARDRNPPFGVVFLDLTGFKAINDGHGHEAGNAVLREAGATVHLAALGVPIDAPLEKRPTDSKIIPFRKSGDEFVVLADEGSDARECAKRLAAAFAGGLRVQYEKKTLEISGAVGLCLREGNSATLKELMDRADAACRVAKFEGSTKVVEWTSDIEANEVDSLRERCSTCGTTTTILFRRNLLKPKALTACGNCGSPITRLVP